MLLLCYFFRRFVYSYAVRFLSLLCVDCLLCLMFYLRCCFCYGNVFVCRVFVLSYRCCCRFRCCCRRHRFRDRLVCCFLMIFYLVLYLVSFGVICLMLMNLFVWCLFCSGCISVGRFVVLYSRDC